MNNKKFEEQIKARLYEQTNKSTILKDKTWMDIDRQLFSSSANKRKKKRKFFVGASVASIIAIIFIGFMAEREINTGQAMLQNLREIFIEEKEQTIELEGQKEDTNVILETNEELRYVIYIDKDRYKLIESEGSDRIVTIEPLPDRYPEVYMEISRVEGVTSAEMVANIKKMIEEDAEMEFRREERVTSPIEAEMIQSMGMEYTDENGVTGHHWNTPIHRYYVTDVVDNQLFVIKQAYFLEAAEGHGARFHYMLESFEVVK